MHFKIHGGAQQYRKGAPGDRASHRQGILCMAAAAAADTSWKITRENRQVTLFRDFYLPVWVDKITAQEYQAYERCLTNEEITREKDKINQQKIENFEEKGVQIIENNVKILNKTSGLEFQYEYVLEEQIGVGQNINPLEETRQPDERNRDNN